MNTQERIDARTAIEAVVTTDDLTRVIDILSAHVVFMDINEAEKSAAFDGLQAALKSIQAKQ